MITLKKIEDKHQLFIEKLYRTTREDELNLNNWPELQKQAFIRMQLFAQLTDYKNKYDGATYQVIFYNKTPIGRLYLWESADFVRVVDISILPNFQGKGIGRSILTDIIKLAKRKNKAVTLHVAPGNPAKKLYQDLGFTKVSDNGFYEYLELKNT